MVLVHLEGLVYLEDPVALGILSLLVCLFLEAPQAQEVHAFQGDLLVLANLASQSPSLL